MSRIFSINAWLPAATPAITSECPARYFVALCITRSNPIAIGFCSTGLAKVLSISEIRVPLFRESDRFLQIHQTQRRIRRRLDVQHLRSRIHQPLDPRQVRFHVTHHNSHPLERRRASADTSRRTARAWQSLRRRSSAPISSALEIAAIPEAVTIAASAPSSAAIFSSATESVGFP